MGNNYQRLQVPVLVTPGAKLPGARYASEKTPAIQFGQRIGWRSAFFKEMNMKAMSTVLVGALAAIVLAVPVAEASGRIRGGGVVANPDGGYSGGRAAAGRGANGGSYARGRAFQTDGQGNSTAASGGAFRGPNGASGARAGTTSRSADGTVTHQSGMAASGAKGSVESSGGYTKTQDGVTQSRTTTATGANGTTYQGSTSYDKNTGLTHSGSCTDAAGNAVPCR